MAIKTENQWKAALVKALRAYGAHVLSLHGHAMQAPGWPDIFVAHRQWSGWIELKASSGELKDAQRLVGRKLEDLDQFVCLRASTTWEVAEVLDVHGDRPPWCPVTAVPIADARLLLVALAPQQGCR